MSEQTYLNDELYAYLVSVSDREPDVLRKLRAETAKMERSFWQISACQGQFMALLVRLTGARRILEVGTFTGYSSTAMALALPPGGRLITLDISEAFTAVARRCWTEAEVDDRIELRLGPAAEAMEALLADGQAGAFDFVFIDADKANYRAYYESGLRLVRTGGLIIVDNTLFDGRVIGQNLEGLAQWQLDWTEDIKAFNAAVHHDDRVTLAMIPVGDGMTLAIKN